MSGPTEVPVTDATPDETPAAEPVLAPATEIHDEAVAGATAVAPAVDETQASDEAPAVAEVTGVPTDQVEGAEIDVDAPVLPADAVEATVDPPEAPATPEVTGVPADVAVDEPESPAS